MDKRTVLILVALFAVMMLWPVIDHKYIQPLFPEPEEPAPTLAHTDTIPTPETPTRPSPEPALEPPPVRPEPDTTEPPVPEDLPREIRWELENEHMRITISSHGAGILHATLKDYHAENTPESPPVHLDLEEHPALLYRDLPGLPSHAPFELEQRDDHTLVLRHQTPQGILIQRTLSLGEDYELTAHDTFTNHGTEPWRAERPTIQIGTISKLEGPALRGMVNIGLDVHEPGEALPRHWGKELPDLFSKARGDNGALPRQVNHAQHDDVNWAALKNKYFALILRPDNGARGYHILAERSITQREHDDPGHTPRNATIEAVAGSLVLPALYLPAQETRTLQATGYIGPKLYDRLLEAGHGQEAIMEFASTGFFRMFNIIMVPIQVSLLRLLNFTHNHIWPHSYGLAIILVTIVIRIIFWPVTHKSTESMKRMAELQPLIKQLRDKYKDDPQKLQQATMALYKEHKVNPMGGCLPMLIQIPVFIALFFVLRNAVELRFAPFLWVRDLSEPENLLASVLPIPLNILPLIMVITQFAQQKMTPTAGDPQQAKMMQFLPLMFLFFFYNMPSGLVLYWTTNQGLMIIQQLYSKRKDQRKKNST